MATPYDDFHPRTRYDYRKSRNTLSRMTAIRLGPERIELAVQVWDLTASDGQVFLRKIHQALADNPKRLVLHLSSGPGLSEAAVGLLAWARAQVEGHGIDFELRPATSVHDEALRQAGLAA